MKGFHTYVSRTNPWPECQMFVSHQLLGAPLQSNRYLKLTPLKPNSCFLPFPPNQIYFTPVFLSRCTWQILSFFCSVTQTKIPGVILDFPLSGKPYIQLISRFPCFCLNYIRNASSFFLCCFCCSSPGYSHHSWCPSFYLYFSTICSQYRSQTEPLAVIF